MQQSVHGSAERMAADDDVLDSQTGHGELDGRPFAAVGRSVGGHDVARVADDEQIAGSVCVIRLGLMRESEHVMNSASGCWPFASRSNNSRLELKRLDWKW